MGKVTVDGHLLRRMIIAGANELERNKQMIDALNVFPVPDGDTGTNMSLTVLAAAREVENLNTPNAAEVAKAASNGSLRGARGNSGVIVSQLFRGFARGIDGHSLITTEVLATALQKASETAYKAVMKPKEGTILTVARALGEKAVAVAPDSEDLGVMMARVMKHGNDVLKRTMNMLPELKAAGVIDAGGKGLLCLLEGALASIDATGEIRLGAPGQKSDESGMYAVPAAISAADIKYAYCTEFFINTPKVTEVMEERLKDYLNGLGDSIVVVGDEDIIKVHVHTNHPGSVLEYALRQGDLSSLKIENMRIQHTNLISFVEQLPEPELPEKNDEPKKEIGFVAVAAGSGLVELFKALGADEVIEGGQTMNPSTEDILAAVERVHAESVFILPNNKNIILAAQQAQELATGCKVSLIPSKTVPQGIAAIINYVHGGTIADNEAQMLNAIGNVKTGQVTYAVRDTKIDEQEIKEGDVLCMLENKIEIVAGDIQHGAKELLDRMLEDGGDIISIYYGEDVDEAAATELSEYLRPKYPDCEIELHHGNQPLYYYILSVE